MKSVHFEASKELYFTPGHLFQLIKLLAVNQTHFLVGTEL